MDVITGLIEILRALADGSSALDDLDDAQLGELATLLPLAASEVAGVLMARADGRDEARLVRIAELEAAGRVALSVLRAQGLYDLSERMAYNTLAVALETPDAPIARVG